MAERRFPWLLALPVVVFAGLGALLFMGLGAGDRNDLPSALIGRKAPQLPEMPLPPAAPFDAAALAAGEVVLVNFWASWCGPCRVEHPFLEKLAAEGRKIYGINYKDDPANAASFLAELGDPYTAMLADPAGRAGIDWGVFGLPETFVIGPDGTVRARLAGPLTSRSYESVIAPAIAAAGG